MAMQLKFMNIFHLAYTNHCYYLYLHKIDEVYYISKNVAGLRSLSTLLVRHLEGNTELKMQKIFD